MAVVIGVPGLKGRFAAWFGAQWAERTPSTWNVSLDAVRSAAAYWMRNGWIAADPSRMLVRRKLRPDRSRALSQADVEALLTREDISIRERNASVPFTLAMTNSAASAPKSTQKPGSAIPT